VYYGFDVCNKYAGTEQFSVGTETSRWMIPKRQGSAFNPEKFDLRTLYFDRQTQTYK